MDLTYPEVLVTNYDTFPYLNENFLCSIDLKLIDILSLLNDGKYLLVGYFDNLPVFIYKTWHDDNHFLIHLKNVTITNNQIIGESYFDNWDKYLKLH